MADAIVDESVAVHSVVVVAVVDVVVDVSVTQPTDFGSIGPPTLVGEHAIVVVTVVVDVSVDVSVDVVVSVAVSVTVSVVVVVSVEVEVVVTVVGTVDVVVSVTQPGPGTSVDGADPNVSVVQSSVVVSVVTV